MTSTQAPFTVQLTDRAWSQIGSLSTAEFIAVRSRLEELAAKASIAPATPGQPLTFDLADVRAHYEVDPSRATVRLMQITRKSVHQGTPP